MIKINEDYLKLKSSYLFAEIAKRVSDYQRANPSSNIIKLGIGDVTKPLPDACIQGFHKGVTEMADEKTFQGYGPYEGFGFLREKIAEFDFKSRGVDISADEVFVSDGAKCDVGNLQEIFSKDVVVAVQDPVYPVYVDTNVMAGRSQGDKDGRYEGFYYLDCTKENGFSPELPKTPVDLIYLCFPNNPTGAVASKADLKKWVDYAKANKSLIIFDAAYECFIRDKDIVHSIYEIEGAKEVAIEARSYSKNAGFTGTRCGYLVIPKECCAYDENGNKHSVHSLWFRRQATKFNGVSYPVQKAAEAIYSEEGRAQVQGLVNYYMKNADLIRENLEKLGYNCTGGDNSPYIWVEANRSSWDFFDYLLEKAGVVCTPGAGFGQCGEGYIRISAFNSHENVIEAMKRLSSL